MAKTLIAFFSRADENYFGGAMRYVKVGNTEVVVGLMKELIEADSFKIEMKDPYSPVYMTCIDQAKKDLREGVRPELVSMPESIDEYDTVVLAYPNYWGTMPMAVVTFLEAFDFTGKTILCLFAQTKAAAWDPVSVISRNMRLVQSLRAAFPLPEVRPHTPRAAFRTGFPTMD